MAILSSVTPLPMLRSSAANDDRSPAAAVTPNELQLEHAWADWREMRRELKLDVELCNALNAARPSTVALDAAKDVARVALDVSLNAYVAAFTRADELTMADEAAEDAAPALAR